MRVRMQERACTQHTHALHKEEEEEEDDGWEVAGGGKKQAAKSAAQHGSNVTAANVPKNAFSLLRVESEAISSPISP